MVSTNPAAVRPAGRCDRPGVLPGNKPRVPLVWWYLVWSVEAATGEARRRLNRQSTARRHRAPVSPGQLLGAGKNGSPAALPVPSGSAHRSLAEERDFLLAGVQPCHTPDVCSSVAAGLGDLRGLFQPMILRFSSQHYMRSGNRMRSARGSLNHEP